MTHPMLKPVGRDADVHPRPAPLSMPARGLDWVPRLRGRVPPVAGLAVRRRAVFGATVVLVLALAAMLVYALAADGLSLGDALVTALFVPNVAWTGFAAATAVLGLVAQRRRSGRRTAVPADWRPTGRTAVLVPARNESVGGLRRTLQALREDLRVSGMGAAFDIFLLSDSDHPRAIATEERLADELARHPDPRAPRVYYRRRTDNAQRKPGNLSEWIRRWGADYAYMLVLDADSRMSARRIIAMVHRMERNPSLGLLQAGLTLTGATSRFGRLQQLATRIYGPTYGAGIAGWSGRQGNYWGHNALIRTRAFAGAAGLPTLPGRPPFGGDVLSHDFIEAAWLCRAGWSVEVDSDVTGSCEGGPQTFEAFHKRDRRWCQGNLQHLRLLWARGLHPVSRLHLLCGIWSYMAAPLWVGLVLAVTLLEPAGAVIWPALGALMLLVTPKIAGVAAWIMRRPGRRGRRLVVGGALKELAVSTLIAPIMLARQTLSVLSVLVGRDCGWKPANGRVQQDTDGPWVEPALGTALLAVALSGTGGGWEVAMVLPLVLPLLLAPAIVPWLERRSPDAPKVDAVVQRLRPRLAPVQAPRRAAG
jgi:membrane glycosyltransferase